jgi:hypothetical protein
VAFLENMNFKAKQELLRHLKSTKSEVKVMTLLNNCRSYQPKKFGARNSGRFSTRLSGGFLTKTLKIDNSLIKEVIFSLKETRLHTLALLFGSFHFSFLVLVDEVTKNENRLSDFLYNVFRLQGKTGKTKMKKKIQKK